MLVVPQPCSRRSYACFSFVRGRCTIRCCCVWTFLIHPRPLHHSVLLRLDSDSSLLTLSLYSSPSRSHHLSLCAQHCLINCSYYIVEFRARCCLMRSTSCFLFRLSNGGECRFWCVLIHCCSRPHHMSCVHETAPLLIPSFIPVVCRQTSNCACDDYSYWFSSWVLVTHYRCSRFPIPCICIACVQCVCSCSLQCVSQ